VCERDSNHGIYWHILFYEFIGLDLIGLG